MRLTDFRALSFDCYGTLIDWERGIMAALAPWFDRHALAPPADRVLEAFAAAEAAEEAAHPTLLYPRILERVMRRLGERFALPVDEADAVAFGASVGDWPAFADSPAALAHLAQHYRLVILSNVDRASFARSNARLGVRFDAIYTAEDIGSYKPSPRNFDYLLERLAVSGIAPHELLHTAESLFHDHLPAKARGLATCWIHRRHGRVGHGATTPPSSPVTPDFRFESLEAMAAAHRAELAIG